MPCTIAQIRSLADMARLKNVILSAAGTMLGYWLSRESTDAVQALVLVGATATATGFGNTINDINDIEGDRISHPHRPLPSRLIPPRCAALFAVILGAAATALGFAVSMVHGVAVVVPLVALAVYTFRLKATPLLGNIMVALLVAFAVLFGGLNAPGLSRLYLPAALAFLLNLTREIVKDVQDERGDRAVGATTSAVLAPRLQHGLIGTFSLAYLGALFLPTVLGHFGMTYATICLVVIVPIHLYRSLLYFRSDATDRLGRISLLLKIEMACGLAALAADELVRQVFA
jgi:geranylgeranylglycerol-phosphate geranylgeranyltransferase